MGVWSRCVVGHRQTPISQMKCLAMHVLTSLSPPFHRLQGQVLLHHSGASLWALHCLPPPGSDPPLQGCNPPSGHQRSLPHHFQIRSSNIHDSGPLCPASALPEGGGGGWGGLPVDQLAGPEVFPQAFPPHSAPSSPPHFRFTVLPFTSPSLPFISSPHPGYPLPSYALLSPGSVLSFLGPHPGCPLQTGLSCRQNLSSPFGSLP